MNIFDWFEQKVGSLEKISHKPGGGNIKVVNEKQLWRKEAKTDHIKRDYQRQGGNIQILDQKSTWSSSPKVGSLENIGHRPGGGNIQILQQPWEKKGVRPKIDTGFLYKEVLVSADYQVKPRMDASQSPASPHTVKSHHLFR